MISQVLLIALMVSAQGNIASARTSYSKCLGGFARAQVKEGVAVDAFETNLAGACKTEEAAFRAASVATDGARLHPRKCGRDVQGQHRGPQAEMTSSPPWKRGDHSASIRAR
jgi:hypothetical protein